MKFINKGNTYQAKLKCLYYKTCNLEDEWSFVQSRCGFDKNVSVQKPGQSAPALTDPWLGICVSLSALGFIY